MEFGIRIISERVILRLGAPDVAWVVEMTVEEAVLIRAVLDRAISRIACGESVAHDFESFMHTIPGHEAV